MTTGGSEDAITIFVVHDALRRDTDQLARAVERGDLQDPARRLGFAVGWAMFKRQLGCHHDGEDRHLWPLARIYLPARDEESAVLDAMEAEHRGIEPLVAAVDAAVGTDDTAWLGEATIAFRQALTAHLDHEERAAVPLLDSVLTSKDWKEFTRVHRKSIGLHGVAEYLPYILDQADPARAAHVTRQLPPPLRLLLRRAWLPRYAATQRWT